MLGPSIINFVVRVCIRSSISIAVFILMSTHLSDIKKWEYLCYINKGFHMKDYDIYSFIEDTFLPML